MQHYTRESTAHFGDVYRLLPIYTQSSKEKKVGAIHLLGLWKRTTMLLYIAGNLIYSVQRQQQLQKIFFFYCQRLHQHFGGLLDTQHIRNGLEWNGLAGFFSVQIYIQSK